CGARVAVRGKGSRLLVAHEQMTDTRAVQGVVEGKHGATRKAKDHLHILAVKAFEQDFRSGCKLDHGFESLTLTLPRTSAEAAADHTDRSVGMVSHPAFAVNSQEGGASAPPHRLNCQLRLMLLARFTAGLKPRPPEH